MNAIDRLHQLETDYAKVGKPVTQAIIDADTLRKARSDLRFAEMRLSDALKAQARWDADCQAGNNLNYSEAGHQQWDTQIAQSVELAQHEATRFRAHLVAVEIAIDNRGEADLGVRL